MKDFHQQRGFTLIEIIVALMIFSIVVVVALAALIKIIDANKKAQNTQDAVIGLSFALESMSREIRTGSSVECIPWTGTFDPSHIATTACTTGHNQLLAFLSTQGYPPASPTCHLAYAYLFSGSAGSYVIQKAQQPNCSYVFSASDFYPILPTAVNMTDYKLGVSYTAGSQPYPLVFVQLSGYAGSTEKSKTYFTVQTASSLRTP